MEYITLLNSGRNITLTTLAIAASLALSGCVSDNTAKEPSHTSQDVTSNASSTPSITPSTGSSDKDFMHLEQWKGRQVNGEPALMVTADVLNSNNAEDLIRYMMNAVPGDKTQYSIGTKEHPILIDVIGDEEEDVQNVVRFVSILDKYSAGLEDFELKEHGSYQDETAPPYAVMSFTAKRDFSQNDYVGLAKETNGISVDMFHLSGYPLSFAGTGSLEDADTAVNLAYEILPLLESDQFTNLPPILTISFDETAIKYPNQYRLTPETESKIQSLVAGTKWQFKHDYNPDVNSRVQERERRLALGES